MSYWKSKVVPKLKKIFEKGGKKKGASEACKHFDSSKESFEKELGEKKEDLHPKVIDIYRSTTAVISKKLLKEPTEPAVKQNPDAVQILLQELAKAGFPGAQDLFDAGVKYGPALLPGPIVYIFEKTSTFLAEEPLPEPTQETRDILIEEVIGKEDTKELETTPEGEITPTETAAPVAEGCGGPSSEEKDGVIPTIEGKKEELTPVVEAKKDESIPAAILKKEDVAPPSEVKPAEAAPVPVRGVPPPIVDKNEAVTTTKEEKKEEVAAPKEEKKEGNKKEEVAAPNDTKKIEVVAPQEVKKEDVKPPTSVPATSIDEKKEKPSEIKA